MSAPAVNIVIEKLSRTVACSDLETAATELEKYAKRRVEAIAYEVLPGGERGDQVGAAWKNEGRWTWWCELPEPAEGQP